MIDHSGAAKKPGPGQYNSRVVNMNERNSPKYSFSLNAKIQDGQRMKTPGPGTYKLGSSLGKQALSKNKRELQYSFGKASREEGKVRRAQTSDALGNKLFPFAVCTYY
jgi:hypothetical protein